jgi:hypothetical protein
VKKGESPEPRVETCRSKVYRYWTWKLNGEETVSLIPRTSTRRRERKGTDSLASRNNHPGSCTWLFGAMVHAELHAKHAPHGGEVKGLDIDGFPKVDFPSVTCNSSSTVVASPNTSSCNDTNRTAQETLNKPREDL